jgi:hypothetical protein
MPKLLRRWLIRLMQQWLHSLKTENKRSSAHAKGSESWIGHLSPATFVIWGVFNAAFSGQPQEATNGTK